MIGILQIILRGLLPCNAAIISQEDDAGKRLNSSSYGNGGKDVMRAVVGMGHIRLLDFIPLPRTAIIIMALYLLHRALNQYRDINYDEGGFGGATFGEVDIELFIQLPFTFVVELIVLLLIFYL